MATGAEGVFAPSRYKSFVAVCTQSSSAAPATDSVIVNELGGSPVWSRDGVGDYDLDLTGAWTASKTIVNITSENAAARTFTVSFASADTLTLLFWDAATPSAAESGNFRIDIRVYY